MVSDIFLLYYEGFHHPHLSSAALQRGATEGGNRELGWRGGGRGVAIGVLGLGEGVIENWGERHCGAVEQLADLVHIARFPNMNQYVSFPRF